MTTQTYNKSTNSVNPTPDGGSRLVACDEPVDPFTDEIEPVRKPSAGPSWVPGLPGWNPAPESAAKAQRTLLDEFYCDLMQDAFGGSGQ